MQALIKTIALRTLLPLRILSVMVWLYSVGASSAAVLRTEVAIDDGAEGGGE